MRANEFVKKFGWAKVKHCNKLSSRDNFFIVGGEVVRDQDLKDLKRLVESYEIVQRHETGSYSALENAKQHVLTLAHIEEYEKMYALEKAIADVESCNA